MSADALAGRAAIQPFAEKAQHKANHDKRHYKARHAGHHARPAQIGHVQERVRVKAAEMRADQNVDALDQRPRDPHDHIADAERRFRREKHPPQARQCGHKGMSSVISPKRNAAQITRCAKTA